MVSGDVGVQVPPQLLDLVLVRAERWKEVKLQPSLVAFECRARQLARVDAVVVQHQVDLPLASVASHQSVNHLDEQLAALAYTVDPYDAAGVSVQRSGDVPLLVLSGSAHPLLTPTHHPVRAGPWVEVDINLILVEERLSRSEALNQRANPSKAALPAACGPRALHEQLRPSPPGAESSQPPRHRRPTHPHLRVHSQLTRQQLARPSRSSPSEVPRNTVEQRCQPLQNPFMQLGLAVAAPAVFQSEFAEFSVPCGHVAHRGAHTEAVAFDVHGAEPLGKLKNHDDSHLHQGTAFAVATTLKSPSLTPGQLGYNPHGGTSF